MAKEQLEIIGESIDLNKTVGELSIANRQLVAICRALSLDAKILFMDEPTTALTNKEVERLLSIVTDLKAKGLSIVFISHKLDEVFKVSDNITIFRDGKKVGDYASSSLDEKTLVYHMTGRDVEYPRYKRIQQKDEPIIEVEGLTRKNNFEDINFSVRKGDIVGITGLLGSGRTELALSLFGLNRYDSGSIKFYGKTVKIDSPQDAVNIGIALLPEDRSTQGLFLDKSINENISSAKVDKLKTKFGTVDVKARKIIAKENVKRFGIRTPSVDLPVKALSGGNQQKTVIAKWMVTNPKLFILDTPTVGVDVGAKAEIYEQIHNFAKEGMAVILISDEYEEIRANCNKVLVMREGRIVSHFDDEEINSPSFRKELESVVNSDETQKEEVSL
ncbi:sugar ABC transporter ATP-binding protein [Neobacillus sp. PS3-12]|uniref:sugar ABC transporter ATP-binding protein n=1 Tax=Neobacillus sp. PS3-12 TaxID=3070677 RepID=UPI0027DFEA19|nr:sugar ABC transporter ATP-binding protein [Neobacillus sp. PS3-12]WML54812.1 sugar ABC transporter ATP-binding protein [Neobacillus sp. PS3-12]